MAFKKSNIFVFILVGSLLMLAIFDSKGNNIQTDNQINSTVNTSSRSYNPDKKLSDKINPETQIQPKKNTEKQGLSSEHVSNEQLKKNRKVFQERLGENYLDAAVSEKGLVRWNPKSFPLKIYIDGKIPESYSKLILKAFYTWQKKTDNYITFAYTQNENSANFIVRLPSQLDNRNCDERGGGVAAYQHFTFKDKLIDKSYIDVSLYNCNNQPYNKDDFYKVVLHEIGHGLGIQGHSSNPNDLMYPTTRSSGEISDADITTLQAVYSIIPDITDKPFTDKDKENLVTSDDVWGDSVTEFKMEETKKNLKVTPKNQGGYISLARGYAKKKEYSRAIDEYANALKYTDNEKDAYGIYLEASSVCIEANQLDRAENILEEASRYYQDDNLAGLYNNLACKYMDNNNYEKAKRILETGLKYVKSSKYKKMYYNNFQYIAVKTQDKDLYNKYKLN